MFDLVWFFPFASYHIPKIPPKVFLTWSSSPTHMVHTDNRSLESGSPLVSWQRTGTMSLLLPWSLSSTELGGDIFFSWLPGAPSSWFFSCLTGPFPASLSAPPLLGTSNRWGLRVSSSACSLVCLGLTPGGLDLGSGFKCHHTLTSPKMISPAGPSPQKLPTQIFIWLLPWHLHLSYF